MDKQRIEHIYQWFQREYDHREEGAPDANRTVEALIELRLDLAASGRMDVVDYLDAQVVFFAGTIKSFGREEQEAKKRIRKKQQLKFSEKERNEIAWEAARYYCMEEEYDRIYNLRGKNSFEETMGRMNELARMGHYRSGLVLAAGLIQEGRQAQAAELLRMLLGMRPSPEAYSMLGDLYSMGQGVERNPDKACECFEKAAEMGHAGAMKAAAEMNYRGGIIHKPSFAKAAEWYHKAAESGERESMYMAGVCDLFCESEKSRPRKRSEEEDLRFWQSGMQLLARSQDKRAEPLLRYANRRLPRRKNIPVMTVRELYKKLRRDEQNQKYIYRGQTQMYQPPLRPSAFRPCQYSRFSMEGEPAYQIRNWGREFYLERTDNEYLFGDEKRKQSHAVRRIMSVYMNNALGYPLAQALFQQAGYSSEGLDVSYDLHIALFFALHEFDAEKGKYKRKKAGKQPSVIYRWKQPENSFSLQDDYYKKAHFIPSLEIINNFGVCKTKEESVASLERYLDAIHWGSLDFDLPDRRPFEWIRLPEEARIRSRIALQKGALLIPDIIPSSGMLQTHALWGYPIEANTNMEYNLVQDLSDPSICDSFMIDCSDLGDADFDILKDIPSPDEIYREGQNDISHILTYNIFERVYEETMRMGTLPIELIQIMPGYGISYLDVLELLQEWNRKKKKEQYFYVFE